MGPARNLRERSTRLDEVGPSESAWRRSAHGIPAVAWVLVAAAAIELLGLAIIRGLFDTEPFPIAVLVSVMTAVTPFLLGAAVLVGTSRWPAARPWLIIAAAAFVLRGLLDAGFDAWLYSWQTMLVVPDASWDWLLTTRAFVVAALSVMAPALLAVGLWVSSRHSSPGSGDRRLSMGALATLGLLATAGSLALAVKLRGSAAGMPAAYWALDAITALVAPAFSVLAISAVRALRAPDLLPELLIAAGAAAAVAGTGWLDWLLSLLQIQDIPFDLFGWLVTLPNGLVLVGLLAVTAGFTSAGLVAPER
jgi:hypothetical protein